MKSHDNGINALGSPRYHAIPVGSGDPCVGRENVLKEIRRALDPSRRGSRLFVLFGMAGVGKTQIALEYANEARKEFEIILWINCTKLVESFHKVAKGLGLVSNSDDEDSAFAKMKTWLLGTSYRWLLVLDGAVDTKLLATIWPVGINGSVLLTSRDSTEIQSLPEERMMVQRLEVLPFDDEAAIDLLKKYLGRAANSWTDHKLEMKIVQAVGGLPLAIRQICRYIVLHALTLEGFLHSYEKITFEIIEQRLSSRKDASISFSSTIEGAIYSLSGNALKLQKLLTFFNPSTTLSPSDIYESLLRRGAQNACLGELNFLQDPSNFSDAQDRLLRLALIARSSMDEALYIHPLVQSIMKRRDSKVENARLFNLVTSLLSSSFPNTWNIVASHQFATWDECHQCILHVGHMIRHFADHRKDGIDIDAFAELILRCTVPGICMSERSTPPQQCLWITLNAISLSYTEMNELDLAEEYGWQAIDVRLNYQSHRIGNSYSNMASIFLRRGLPDAAEEMLKKCPSIKDFTDKDFLDSKNPRFSGDVVLLSRIRLAQNRPKEALELSLAALNVRKKVLGPGLKTCASLYLVASLQHRCGQLPDAEETLLELVSITHNHYTQALFKLSEVCNDIDKRHTRLVSSGGHQVIASPRSMAYRDEAIKSLGSLINNTFLLYDVSEYDYDKLTPWMLW
ncbi:P-loop containing nucleoside triphosphate hydrolase protein [Halenospora varia]|nr:P-loop containing nucleoside triphosphate hydrolase protein [Halenospora varia]